MNKIHNYLCCGINPLTRNVNKLRSQTLHCNVDSLNENGKWKIFITFLWWINLWKDWRIKKKRDCSEHKERKNFPVEDWQEVAEKRKSYIQLACTYVTDNLTLVLVGCQSYWRYRTNRKKEKLVKEWKESREAWYCTKKVSVWYCQIGGRTDTRISGMTRR